MRDLDLTSLRLFIAVCETRNMARAAQTANLVGSAVSKRLAQLEAQMGVPLLQRRRHGVEPTAAGFTLLEQARDMLATANRIEQAMSGYAAGVRGEVRVLASASVMAESLADDVAAFLSQPPHRDIRVTMEEMISPDIVRRVREGAASLGICWDAADTTGLTTAPYRSDTLMVAVHPAHPLAARPSLRFTDTLDFEQVSMPVSSAVQVLLARAAAAAGKRVLHRVVVTNFEAALRVVRANLAISVVPREVAAPYLDVYGLRCIPLEESWAERRFTMCYRDGDTLSAAARLLIGQLRRDDPVSAVQRR
ncbi:MAG: LysR family transcriptional regulator [Burkholderiales bacterium]|nr:LysR family transcriptional regulator [Burkholderiales bacterium]